MEIIWKYNILETIALIALVGVGAVIVIKGIFVLLAWLIFRNK